MDFFIDTNARDSESLQTFISPFPIFSSSNFALGVDNESENSEEEIESDGEVDDEYFGEF
jgi:hypothetical protein